MSGIESCQAHFLSELNLVVSVEVFASETCKLFLTQYGPISIRGHEAFDARIREMASGGSRVFAKIRRDELYQMQLFSVAFFEIRPRTL